MITDALTFGSSAQRVNPHACNVDVPENISWHVRDVPVKPKITYKLLSKGLALT